MTVAEGVCAVFGRNLWAKGTGGRAPVPTSLPDTTCLRALYLNTRAHQWLVHLAKSTELNYTLYIHEQSSAFKCAVFLLLVFFHLDHFTKQYYTVCLQIISCRIPKHFNFFKTVLLDKQAHEYTYIKWGAVVRQCRCQPCRPRNSAKWNWKYHHVRITFYIRQNNDIIALFIAHVERHHIEHFFSVFIILYLISLI